MERAITAIRNFTPSCEQEEVDKTLFLDLLANNPKCLTRDLIGHFTASAWVMNPARDKILCAHHNLYKRWAWLGGHCDGDDDFLAVIKREIAEESGVTKLEQFGDGIFSLESLSVVSHQKNGKYVPAHCHWNITYAFIADEDCYIRIKEDENSEVGWLYFDELVDRTPDTTSVKAAYRKIIDKVRRS
ncbi:MAG: NUDIX hydrolase [Firmicutes bacterium]|nr:NUDIX hydrolase [Bacillota bacterium]